MDSRQHVVSLATLRTQVPGLHDDNQARAEAITRVVGEADSVWVVSRITRACNDKTARALVPTPDQGQGRTPGGSRSLALPKAFVVNMFLPEVSRYG